MADPPQGTARQQEEVARLVSIPEMPGLLEAAGLKSVGAPRIRQLAADPDSGFPTPVYERGRLRLWDWSAALDFFRTRVVEQGKRTDLLRKREPHEAPRDGTDDS